MARFALIPAILIAAIRLHAEVTPGEMLLAEMNCVACHSVPEPLKERLASRQAPKLDADGVRVTPHWLREFLLDPQKAKPGTLMPDCLHALPPEQKAQAADALTHYLISIQGPEVQAERGLDANVVARGEQLYHQTGCVQCHAPTRFPDGAGSEGRESDPTSKQEFEQLQTSSVPIGAGIARKYALADLTRFLRNPLKSRTAGRMPSMNLSENEAQAIAMFLLREQKAGGGSAFIRGLHYELFRKEFPELPDFDRLAPDVTGSVEAPTLSVAGEKANFALRFSGKITVPKDGRYKFYTESDDGSRLFIDGKLVVDNGGIHPAQERGSEIDLKAGPHDFVLTYFQGGGEAVLKVRWRGPDLAKQEIPADVFSHDGQPMVPVGDAPFTLDSAKVERGKTLYAEMNCEACHQGGAPVKMAKPLEQLAVRQPRGCLSTEPTANAPKFEINDRQRQVMLALLQEQTPLRVPLDDEQRIRRTMTALNCYACHQRDKRGGSSGLRRDYFVSLGEVDLGEEGRIPPSLTGAGTKLRLEWVKEVLEQGTKVRPYMAARMPVFGAANTAHLPELFDRADRTAESSAAPNVFTPEAGRIAKTMGRKLVGTGGLSCIACHKFAGNDSLGIPAIDLATTATRLKWDWFRRYLVDPPSLRPGTRMPSFWPGGAAVNRDILGGKTDKQIEAIWAYLSGNNFSDLPDGLIRGSQELVAVQEAVIYRNFIEGGGSRAIGVGYPEKANLCFDANEMRLAMIWRGPFIDAARHRTGRGEGYEKPLGTNLVRSPGGPAFAVLASESAAWSTAMGRSGGYQFRGYRLDEKQRPAFLYRFQSIDIEDHPIAVATEGDASFRRTITLKAPAPVANLYFRAAAAEKIADKGDGTFVVDEHLLLKFPGSQPRLRSQDGKMELLIPVIFQNGQAQLVQEIVW